MVLVPRPKFLLSPLSTYCKYLRLHISRKKVAPGINARLPLGKGGAPGPTGRLTQPEGSR